MYHDLGFVLYLLDHHSVVLGHYLDEVVSDVFPAVLCLSKRLDIEGSDLHVVIYWSSSRLVVRCGNVRSRSGRGGDSGREGG